MGLTIVPRGRHRMYENQLARLLETSDLVLDATAPSSDLAAHVENAAREASACPTPPGAVEVDVEPVGGSG